MFVQALSMIDVWTLLDGFVTRPTCSQLRRVDINIILLDVNLSYGEQVVSQIEALLPQKLPLLSSEGILSMEVLMT
jgi:hypothetical protein